MAVIIYVNAVKVHFICHIISIGNKRDPMCPSKLIDLFSYRKTNKTSILQLPHKRTHTHTHTYVRPYADEGKKKHTNTNINFSLQKVIKAIIFTTYGGTIYLLCAKNRESGRETKNVVALAT